MQVCTDPPNSFSLNAANTDSKSIIGSNCVDTTIATMIKEDYITISGE